MCLHFHFALGPSNYVTKPVDPPFTAQGIKGTIQVVKHRPPPAPRLPWELWRAIRAPWQEAGYSENHILVEI